MLEKIIGVMFIVLMALFCAGSCIVSSRCSRWEEQNEEETLNEK